MNASTSFIIDSCQQMSKTLSPYANTSTRWKSEINPADYYRKSVILLLSRFSIFFKNAKSFEEITREDLLLFLDSFRKSEMSDPLHRLIGTYNLFRIHLMRFFKWLYYPDIKHKQRPRPHLIENIPKAKEKGRKLLDYLIPCIVL